MLNESIIRIRVELQSKNLKKSGRNKFANFDYFELSDFLPTLNELMMKEGVNDQFSIIGDRATLTLIKGEEKQMYEMPFVMFGTPLNKNGTPSMQDIQYLGALNTYYKRYLYLNAFGITDGEVIDSMDNTEIKGSKKQTKQEPKKDIKQFEPDAFKGQMSQILNDLQRGQKALENLKYDYTYDNELLIGTKINNQDMEYLKTLGPEYIGDLMKLRNAYSLKVRELMANANG